MMEENLTRNGLNSLARAWAEVSQCDESLHAAARVLEFQKEDPHDAQLHEIWAYAIAPYKPHDALQHYQACAILYLQQNEQEKAQHCITQGALIEKINRANV